MSDTEIYFRLYIEDISMVVKKKKWNSHPDSEYYYIVALEDGKFHDCNVTFIDPKDCLGEFIDLFKIHRKHHLAWKEHVNKFENNLYH